MKRTSKLASFCCECGPNVKVDEDGLCAACGATATGSALGQICLHDPVGDALIAAARKLPCPPDALFDALERYEASRKKR